MTDLTPTTAPASPAASPVPAAAPGVPTGPVLDDAVLDVVARRRITDVLHFTTNHGLLGIAASGALLSRDDLNESNEVEHIRRLNCDDRLKDTDWTGYVSMSITAVNTRMLGSSEGWQTRREGGDIISWAVLSFDPEVLAHPGVHFVTTNNTYDAVLRRGTGAAALEALFGPAIKWGYYGSVMRRGSRHEPHEPTDPQAEVLYPVSVPLSYLRAIYVREEELIDHIAGIQAVFPDLTGVQVECRPQVFR